MKIPTLKLIHVCLLAAVAVVLAPSAKVDSTVSPQQVRAIIVENPKAGTADQDSTEQVLQSWAEASKNFYKKVPFDAKDKDGKTPSTYARFIDAWNASGSTDPMLFVVAESTGKILWSGKLPDRDSALTVAKKYGGG